MSVILCSQMRFEAQQTQQQQLEAWQQEAQMLQTQLAEFHGLPADMLMAKHVCAAASERADHLGAAFDEQFADAGYF